MPETKIEPVVMLPSQEFVATARALRGRASLCLMIDDGNFRLAPPELPKVQVDELAKAVEAEEPASKRSGAFYEALYKRKGRRR